MLPSFTTKRHYKGGQLRVIINKPFKENKMPAMLFIPGYTCSSIDELTKRSTRTSA
jgi:hypothetical protein